MLAECCRDTSWSARGRALFVPFSPRLRQGIAHPSRNPGPLARTLVVPVRVTHSTAVGNIDLCAHPSVKRKEVSPLSGGMSLTSPRTRAADWVGLSATKWAKWYSTQRPH